MRSYKFPLYSLTLSVLLAGCGGGAEPKQMPKVEDAKKAELDKDHAEMKAKMESKAAEAPK